MGKCDFQRHRELEQADGPFCSFRLGKLWEGRIGKKVMERYVFEHPSKCAHLSSDGSTMRLSEPPGISREARMKDTVIAKLLTWRRAPPTPHPAQLVAGNSGVHLDESGVVLPGVSS